MYTAAAEKTGNDLIDGRGDAYCGMLNCSYNLGLRKLKAVIPEYPVGTADGLCEMITDLVKTRRLCYVGCNYLQAGSTAAGLLVLMASDQLNLLLVTGSFKIKGHNDRIRGFSRMLRAKKVSYKLVRCVLSA